MLQTHLKLAWRNLLKSRYISAINLLGLVVGMTAAMLLWQYVAFEKSYDDFNELSDRIVRVRTDRVNNDGEVFMQFAAGAAGAAPFMHKNFPEVVDYTKLHIGAPGVFAYGERNFREEKALFASETFFNLFSIQVLKGNPETALADPFTACISASKAKKYFGTQNPLGKTLKRNGGDEFKITGVYEDWPASSHLKPDILLSYKTFNDVYNPGEESETRMYWDGYYSYLLLQENTDIAALEAKIPAVLEQQYDQEVRENVQLKLQSLDEIHLNSHYLFEAEINGDAEAVRSLFIIGFLVLLIAWFNYINLATARSEARAKEVGVRKVIGSNRGQLIRQFLVEAALINILAIVISLALTKFLHPWFEQVAGKTISLSLFSEPKLWISILTIFFLGTLLAGLYPAFILSSFNPGDALKGLTSRKAGRDTWLRKGLVITQFAGSIILIAGTIIIFQQLKHMRETNLGVNIDQTLVIDGPSVNDSTLVNKFNAFKQSLVQLSAVESLVASTSVPGRQVDWTAGIRLWGGSDDSFEGLQAIATDYQFMDQYGLEVAAGRLFDENMRSDSSACILNEQGVKRLNLGTPEEALGADVDFWGDKLTVVGVVKNFHQRSPKMEFEPLIFRTMRPRDYPGYFSVKTNTAGIDKTLATIEAKWNKLFPGNPFEYFFLDESFDRQFEADQRLGGLIALFAILAIFVSCLGLFALAAFVAERRTKEIGIRKVLGASVENLVALLSKEFLILVAIAIIIATPIAWFGMNNWLENFAQRININWSVFILAGVAALIIAFVTMSFHSIRAALANPSESLKSE